MARWATEAALGIGLSGTHNPAQMGHRLDHHLPHHSKLLKDYDNAKQRMADAFSDGVRAPRNRAAVHLDLENLSSLMSLPEEIENLQTLTSISLSGCANLVRLPASLCQLQNLRQLDVTDCVHLEGLPNGLYSMPSLNQIFLGGCSEQVKNEALQGAASHGGRLSVGEKPNHWDRLPETTQSQIFHRTLRQGTHGRPVTMHDRQMREEIQRRAEALSLVGKRWRDDVRATLPIIIRDPRMLAQMAASGNFSSVTDLKMEGRFSADDLGTMRRAFPNLRTLSLKQYGIRLSDEGLAELPGLPLVELNIHPVDFNPNNPNVPTITDTGLVHIGKCSELKKLCLGGVPALTNDGLANLKNLRKLELLELEDWHQITDAGMIHVGQLAGLKSLTLSWGEGNQTGPGLSNAGLQALQHLTGLKTLSIAGPHPNERGRATTAANPRIDDDGMMHLRGLQDLESLSLRGFEEITYRGLATLLRKTPDQSYASRQSNVTFPKLKELDLSFCLNVSRHAPHQEATMSLICGTLNRLELLRIREIGLKTSPHMSSMRNLQELDLGQNLEIDDSDLINLRGLNSLKHLILDDCHRLTAERIGELATLLPRTNISWEMS